MIEDKILKHMIKLPVVKRTKQYTCGQWSFVYPPFKGVKPCTNKRLVIINRDDV